MYMLNFIFSLRQIQSSDQVECIFGPFLIGQSPDLDVWSMNFLTKKD